MNPQIFHLQRDHDVSGVSGTGRVANGVLWPDGTVSLRWVGERPSTVHWDRLADAIAIHGHGGATRLVWTVPQPPTADQAAAALAEVRRLCELTITASVRVQAIDQARDTLALIDRVMGGAGARQDGAQPS